MNILSAQGYDMYNNVDRKTKIIAGNITGDVVRPLDQLVIEKMYVNIGYYIM